MNNKTKLLATATDSDIHACGALTTQFPFFLIHDLAALPAMANI